MMRQKYNPTLHLLESSSAFRCLWALEELSSAYGTEYHVKFYRRQHNLLHSELKEVFPVGKSPILTLDAAPGEEVPTIQILPGILTEAQLILRFLSDEYAHGLWSPETEEDIKRDVFFQGYYLSLGPRQPQ
ncbi:hypothetical protein F4778DRAFT_759123 [Xylariomycetidae sp. FL2044]|nr:hypothetical protein F4778DRAFT_759123 [Xylariomycetidae sp. FL2044]